jgi:NAD(P)-dependent dehydrogenase (short-subunit alcohol dehydrogenase family)
MRFQDKTVIATGGASGIGEASVRLFAAEGARVVIADFSEHGQALADELGAGCALFVKTDVTDSAQVQALMARTVEVFGRIDVLFANAGIANDGPVDVLGEDAWQRTIDINLTGVFLCDKYAAERMIAQGGGVIVNCGSIHSHVGKGGVAAYAAAKAGEAATQTLAIDLAPRASRGRGVPGLHRHAAAGRAATGSEGAAQGLASDGPARPRAEEVARTVLFLASDDASFVTGLAAGGWRLHRAVTAARARMPAT